MKEQITRLQGPILVLGASGFIGANLFRLLSNHRKDVFGTASHFPAWRLEGFSDKQVFALDLLVDSNLTSLLDQIQPRTVFDCTAYGAYSFERETRLIYQTNLLFKVKLLEELQQRDIACYLHAGSSSEYGDDSECPSEEQAPAPNSHYAVSKAGTAGLIYYFGRKLGLPCANLRLYSVYGPWEDAARLIPTLIAHGLEGKYPPLVDPSISRDFVHVEDACEAFIQTAIELRESDYGASFNIGSGISTTIAEIAQLAKKLFQLEADPVFSSMPNRDWDTTHWQANIKKAETALNWKARTPLEAGLSKTTEWLKQLPALERYRKVSKKFGPNTEYSVTAIIACYKDGQAIPIMYERLTQVFTKLNVDYEIIFVNDNSPDQSEAVIQEISRKDRHVIGISHSRNFGSQAAFRSGMEIASKNACVLLDGDLQDPPELIEKFMEQWKAGYDVVYGRRVQREAPRWMQVAYKLFYRIFDKFSYIRIPHDAGDFSLMDKKVIRCLLQFPERDLFIRGIRAFAGFRQTGVDYVRPERMFGVSTNNLFKNIGWAKKGILAFSNTPLNILSFMGVAFFLLSVVLGSLQILSKILFPDIAPAGITTVLFVITFFGSINLLGISLVGEYIAKIFEEVKRRPHFLRRSIIRDGEIRDAVGPKPMDSHLSKEP